MIFSDHAITLQVELYTWSPDVFDTLRRQVAAQLRSFGDSILQRTLLQNDSPTSMVVQEQQQQQQQSVLTAHDMLVLPPGSRFADSYENGAVESCEVEQSDRVLGDHSVGSGRHINRPFLQPTAEPVQQLSLDSQSSRQLALAGLPAEELLEDSPGNTHLAATAARVSEENKMLRDLVAFLLGRAPPPPAPQTGTAPSTGRETYSLDSESQQPRPTRRRRWRRFSPTRSSTPHLESPMDGAGALVGGIETASADSGLHSSQQGSEKNVVKGDWVQKARLNSGIHESMNETFLPYVAGEQNTLTSGTENLKIWASDDVAGIDSAIAADFIEELGDELSDLALRRRSLRPLPPLRQSYASYKEQGELQGLQFRPISSDCRCVDESSPKPATLEFRCPAYMAAPPDDAGGSGQLQMLQNGIAVADEAAERTVNVRIMPFDMSSHSPLALDAGKSRTLDNMTAEHIMNRAASLCTESINAGSLESTAILENVCLQANEDRFGTCNGGAGGCSGDLAATGVDILYSTLSPSLPSPNSAFRFAGSAPTLHSTSLTTAPSPESATSAVSRFLNVSENNSRVACSSGDLLAQPKSSSVNSLVYMQSHPVEAQLCFRPIIDSSNSLVNLVPKVDGNIDGL